MGKKKTLSISEVNVIIKNICNTWTEEKDLKINRSTGDVLRGHSLKGRKLSLQHKTKVSVALKNIKRTEEFGKKIAASKLGTKRSEESKKKQSLSRKNSKTCAEALARSRQKAQETMGVSVTIEGVVYKNQTDAAAEHGLSLSGLRKRLNSTSQRFKEWYLTDSGAKETKSIDLNKKPINADGVVYETLQAAAEACGISAVAISKGIRRSFPKYKNWRFLTEKEYSEYLKHKAENKE